MYTAEVVFIRLVWFANFSETNMFLKTQCKNKLNGVFLFAQNSDVRGAALNYFIKPLL
jgi:hypothetical protein